MDSRSDDVKNNLACDDLFKELDRDEERNKPLRAHEYVCASRHVLPEYGLVEQSVLLLLLSLIKLVFMTFDEAVIVESFSNDESVFVGCGECRNNVDPCRRIKGDDWKAAACETYALANKIHIKVLFGIISSHDERL